MSASMPKPPPCCPMCLEPTKRDCGQTGCPNATARREELAKVRAENADYLTRGLELAKALSNCITAINPPDRDGISMHEWDRRLKAATKQACAALAGGDNPVGDVVEAGYVIVPKEPTAAMCNAGADMPAPGTDFPEAIAGWCWRAMIAARPKD